MKKIVHLSDLHVGFKGCHKNLQIVIQAMIDYLKPNNDYVVVVTGDLVENAKVETFQIVDEELQKLRDMGFDVLVVPGNHDYGKWGIIGRRKWVKIFKQVFFKNPNINYPIKTIIDDVAFIGLDSMEAELNWYDRLGSDGEIGRKQIYKLNEFLTQDNDVLNCSKKVVYMHHHAYNPFRHLVLKDANDLKIVIEGKVDALLFGHNHHGRNFNGFWRIPRCLEGGSSTAKEDVPTSIRVIDLEKDPKTDYMMDILTFSKVANKVY